nr:hypothetical protein [Tanacetum cinerariifolium]
MFLSQKKYAIELLDRAHMASCNPTRTSVDMKSKLSVDGDPVADPTLYHSLAGGLQYMTFTHPDISYVVQQVGCPATRHSTSGYCVFLGDNLLSWLAKRAIYLTANLVQHQQTKHIEIDIHFVRDMVARGHVRVLHVPSHYQYADIFTNGFSSTLFEEFRSSLSVRSFLALTVEEC